MSLYLAIDAGGTKTDYLLADAIRQRVTRTCIGTAGESVPLVAGHRIGLKAL